LSFGISMVKKQKTKVVAYNPLDKINLAKSIESELLARPVDSLASINDISGAGVYAIDYTGPFTAYACRKRQCQWQSEQTHLCRQGHSEKRTERWTREGCCIDGQGAA
jgi:hypothetical protein